MTAPKLHVCALAVNIEDEILACDTARDRTSTAIPSIAWTCSASTSSTCKRTFGP